MADLETQLSLEADESSTRELADEAGAQLVRDAADSSIYWLVMHPRASPGETFVARVAWSSYPHSPPSVKFADGVGGRLDVSSAWPIIPGYRPGSYDICQPFTAEGFAVHPEWVSGPDAWVATGNPLAW